MAERRAGEIRGFQTRSDAHIRDVAGSSSPAEQIASAKALQDSGAITADDFDRLKAKALA